MSKTRRTTSCGATVPFQRFCLSLNATSKRDPACRRSSCAAEAERDRAARVAPVLAHAEAQVLALADGRGADRLAARDEQRHVGVPEAERRQLLELAGELERERRCGDDRVDPRHGRQVLVRELLVGVRGERRGERLELVGPDRQAGGGPVAAEALEVAGAGGEAGVQVEARHRPAGSLPAVAFAGDQHDGAAEPLDEPRGDDADHALVPALAPDDVGTAAALLRRPGVDGGDGLAEDPAPRPPAGRG